MVGIRRQRLRRGNRAFRGGGMYLYPTTFGMGDGEQDPEFQRGGFGFWDVASFLGKNVLLPFARSAMERIVPEAGSAVGQLIGKKLSGKILGRGGVYVYAEQPALGTIGAHGEPTPTPFRVGTPVKFGKASVETSAQELIDKLLIGSGPAKKSQSRPKKTKAKAKAQPSVITKDQIENLLTGSSVGPSSSIKDLESIKDKKEKHMVDKLIVGRGLKIV